VLISKLSDALDDVEIGSHKKYLSKPI